MCAVQKITLKKSARGLTYDKSLRELVNDLPYGTYNIYVAEADYKTTASQRKLFWMWMGCMEQWSGTSRIEWHDYYVKKFLPPYKHGISDISTKAMYEFMEMVQSDAITEWGVTLPLPRDLDIYNEFVLEYKNR